jgi:hypothetical protein
MSFKNNEKRKGNKFSPRLTPFAQSKYSDIHILYEMHDYMHSYILIIALYILPLILFRLYLKGRNFKMYTQIEEWKNIYEKLFNIMFDKGLVPHIWLIGTIRHIYKNKGDIYEPKN